MKKLLTLSILTALLPGMIMAADFGLVMNQYFEMNSADKQTDNPWLEYSGMLIPRMEFLFGDPRSPQGNLFVSAGITIKQKGGFRAIPELLRTEFSMQREAGEGALGLSVGRFHYAAPLPFLAEGLFDGVQASYSSHLGRFSGGVWYTGLLYKETLVIDMTANDRIINEKPVYGDDGAYFAPPRLLLSADWEHLALANFLRLQGAFTAQFDLSDADAKYNSQYFTLKLGLPISAFLVEAGGILSTFQSDESGAALAGDLDLSYIMPTRFPSRLSFNVRSASGGDGSLGSFTPITLPKKGTSEMFLTMENSLSVSDIFDARMSALTILSLNYLARFTPKIGANFSAKYFLRNDITTFNAFIFDEKEDEPLKDGSILGTELAGRFMWSPLSDLHFNADAGVFIPAFGKNGADGRTAWFLSLTAVIALY